MINIKKNKWLTIEEVKQIVYENKKISIDSDVKKEVTECYDFLETYSKNKIIYGINTGLGPMAQYRVSDSECLNLQYNLIRSHAAGMGNPIPTKETLAAVITRLNCFTKAKSGIHIELIEVLTDMINYRIIPFIPEHGSVGASGDLVQLAHLALNIIGEGKVLYDNKWQDAKDVFKQLNIIPFEIKIREGLSMINGTAVMTGIGIINIIMAKKLLKWNVAASTLINELVNSCDDHFSEELNSVKNHEAQSTIARWMREWTVDSQMLSKRKNLFYKEYSDDDDYFETKVQEYYSLRCLPQILGPILETIQNTENILERELNSVSDNPIIEKDTQEIFHGGNFHGDYISLEMDKLRIVMTRMSMLSDRQLNYLLNQKINELFPPFMNLGKPGYTLGMQGAQFTAVSTTAENQTLSNSMYVHSIPNNNDNQDIVSMGTNSALLTKKVIDNAYQVFSIHLFTIMQAVDYRQCYDKLSSKSKLIFDFVREDIASFTEDYVLNPDLELLKKKLIESDILDKEFNTK